MSVTYDICWGGRLYDPIKQKRLTSELNQLAQIYNDIYFGEDKDETTLCFFDQVTLKGQILISSDLLNIPDNYSINDLFPLKSSPIYYEFLCSEVKVYGIQFRIKGDPCITRLEKSDCELLSYVFWGFNSVTEEIPFVKCNIAKINKLANDSYQLVTPWISSRLLKPWFAVYLYEYLDHYYFRNLEIENSMLCDNSFRSNFSKDLMEKDPEANNEEVKNEAFKELLEEISRIGQLCKEIDEIELEHRKE